MATTWCCGCSRSKITSICRWPCANNEVWNMSVYETLPPNNFLGLDDEHSGYERSAALILPIPYEGTVSYGQGTREGPRAILEASRQVELYDRELDDEIALTYGIHTLQIGRASCRERV